MHHTKGSNPLVITWPLVFLAALYVPTPIQSQRPFGLVSAIVDKENPNDGNDVFTLDTYTMIELTHIGSRISQVRALRNDGTEKIAQFRSLDYHTMILGVVIFNTGDQNREVKCEFKNKEDAEEFYRFITPTDRNFQFYKTSYPIIIMVLQYDCTRADCGYGTVNDRFSDGNYYQGVMSNATIYSEKGNRTVDNQTLLKRFLIRGEDGATNMMFTSKTFNLSTMGKDRHVMMSIRTKYLSSNILIQFKDINAALCFKGYAQKNYDLDGNIPLNIPYPWQEYFSYP